MPLLLRREAKFIVAEEIRAVERVMRLAIPDIDVDGEVMCVGERHWWWLRVTSRVVGLAARQSLTNGLGGRTSKRLFFRCAARAHACDGVCVVRFAARLLT